MKKVLLSMALVAVITSAAHADVKVEVSRSYMILHSQIQETEPISVSFSDDINKKQELNVFPNNQVVVNFSAILGPKEVQENLVSNQHRPKVAVKFESVLLSWQKKKPDKVVSL